MSYFKHLWRRFHKLPLWTQIGAGILLLVVIVAAVHFLTQGPSTASTDTQAGISHVQLESVASLSSPSGPLPVIGKVSSESQATILAQTSGEITSLNVSIGQQVGAGQVIAEFQNASQQAAVLQAQGQYNAALASLASAQGATAANSSLTSSQAANAAQTAGTSAVAAMQSAYAALDDAIHTKADVLFTNPRSTSVTPTFNLTIPDNQLQVNLVNERVGLEATLADAHAQAYATSSASIDARISALSADAQIVSNFLNNMVQATNEAEVTQTVTAAQIAAYQSSMGAARTEVVSAIASLVAAQSSYDAAQTSSQTAANTAGSGTQNSIAAAQAQVQVALGGLGSAKAALENTIVRSPINGAVVSLPVTQGTYVSAYSQVAQVSNPNALEIDTYVTPDDAKTLAVGGKATIESSAAGVITSIAPAIDPTTGEIGIKIGITSGASSLTDGDTVTISLARSQTATTQAQSTNTSAITIPITAAKITPQGAIVFTVSSSTLVSNPITLGTILGDQVQVANGLTPEMNIVKDARGLSEGQQVIVDSQ